MLSSSILNELNIWAVLAAGLCGFFLGGLWYSPALFEGAWMRANGYGAEEVAAMQSAMGVLGFAGALLAYVAVALVLGLFFKGLGVGGIGIGLLVAFAVWAGFVAPTGFTVNLFSTRPVSAWAIDASFQLVALAVMGLILSLWR